MASKTISLDFATAEILNAADITDGVLKLNGQLDRPTYQRVNEVLEALGGKWNRKAGGHVFSDPAHIREQIEDVLTAGALRVNPFDYWPTPPALARQIARMAASTVEGLDAPRILEPSAGQGALLDELRAWLALETLINNPRIEAVEIESSRVGALRMRGYEVTFTDFLTFCPTYRFNLIVMNPPFNAPEKRNVYIDHIRHAFDLLARGAHLFAIAPVGFTFNDRLGDFKAWVGAHGKWEPLGTNSFKESGTGVNTVLITLEN